MATRSFAFQIWKVMVMPASHQQAAFDAAGDLLGAVTGNKPCLFKKVLEWLVAFAAVGATIGSWEGNCMLHATDL